MRRISKRIGIFLTAIILLLTSVILLISDSKKVFFAGDIVGSEKWSLSSFPVKYYVSTTNLPVGITQEDFRDVVDRAFKNWMQQPNLNLTVQFMDFTSAIPGVLQADPPDSANVIGFRKLEIGLRGLTRYWTAGNERGEADIAINTHYQWATNYEGGKNYLESLLTHEIGHFLGLKDEFDDQNAEITMNPKTIPGMDNSACTPEAVDIAALQTMYPRIQPMNPNNQAPILSQYPDTIKVTEGETLNLSLSANDPGDSLAFYILNFPKQFAYFFENSHQLIIAPQAGHAGLYKDIQLSVQDGYLSDYQRVDIEVAKALSSPFLAQTEETVNATKSGDLTGTHFRDDNNVEKLSEVLVGKGNNSTSRLEYKWKFQDIVASSTVCAAARKIPSVENEDFTFQYSTNNVNYNNLFDLSNTNYDINLLCSTLPETVSGNVWIRVIDKDTTSRKIEIDSVEVDLVRIRKIISPFAITDISAQNSTGLLIGLTWKTTRAADSHTVYREDLLRRDNSDMVTDHNLSSLEGADELFNLYDVWSIDNNGIVAFGKPGRIYIGGISSVSDTPDPFTPDGDGVNDIVTISVNLKSQHYLRKVRILDAESLKKWLDKDFSASYIKDFSPPTGQEYFDPPSVIWDGKKQDGSVVTPGTYYYAVQVDSKRFPQDPWDNKIEYLVYGSIHVEKKVNKPPSNVHFSGPTDLSLGIGSMPDYRYYASDPEGGSTISYFTDWGDGNGFVSSGAGGSSDSYTNTYHRDWTTVGTFSARAYAQDVEGATSTIVGPVVVNVHPAGYTDSKPGVTTVGNQKNYGPAFPGLVYIEFWATDNDAPWLSYYIDWGDGTKGFSRSSIQFNGHGWQRHQYRCEETYYIDAQAIDTHGSVGPWMKRKYKITVNCP